jgi:hypothetical protein
MSVIQALLTSYYLCDAAASHGALDTTAILHCIGVYQSVKAQFLTEEELAALGADPLGFGGEQGQVAYRRFSAWETANPTIVARLRAEAEARLRREEAAAF